MIKPENLRFPPSSADRWLTCHASVRDNAEAAKKQRGTIEPKGYANAGIVSHTLAEYCLKNNVSAEIPGEKTILAWAKIQGVEVDQTMRFEIQQYLDYVYALMAPMTNPELHVELPIDISTVTGIDGHSAVIDVLIIDGANREAHIVDLKEGRGIVIEAFRNPQLMIYGAATAYDFEDFYDIDTFYLHIVQPPRDNTDCWEIDAAYLKDWAQNRVKPTVKRIINGSQQSLAYAPSEKACRFCRANSPENGYVCRALADKALGTAADNLSEIIQPFDEAKARPDIQLIDVTSLTPDEIFNCMKNVDLISVFSKAVTGAAQGLLENNEAPENCGFKLVEGKTNRKWKDEDKADKALARAGLNAKTRKKPQELISVPAAEKLLGKKHKILQTYVEKPPGKATIAKDSDKRPALITDVTEGFFDDT